MLRCKPVLPRLLWAMAMLAAASDGVAGGWISDARGCKVWNEVSIRGESVEWSGPCPTGIAQGQGTLRWLVNGKPVATYTGELQAGIYEGQGNSLLDNGMRYAGQFRGGMPAGEGELSWPDGHVYKGEFKAGLPSGRGVMAYANGNRYEGEFSAGRATGRGLLTWAKGDRYEGEVVNATPQGVGKLICRDGRVFIGRFVAGRLDGEAEVTWPSGARYAGLFKADKFDGHGRMTWSHGESYEGDWRADRMGNAGKASLANGDSYVGELKDGQWHGQGVYRWVSGDVYTGKFSEGQAQQGLYRFADGTSYDGDFLSGLPHGAGLLTARDGRQYAGRFDDGVPAPGWREVAPEGRSGARLPAELTRLRFLETYALKVSNKVVSPLSVCSKLGRPEAPSLNWAGTAVLKVKAFVRDGRVQTTRVTTLSIEPPSERVETALVELIKRLVRGSYECPGNHVFEQEFAFDLEWDQRSAAGGATAAPSMR